MSSKTGMILGAILIVVGLVWVFQGTGHLGGSFMTGRSEWTWIGAATAGVGAFFLLWFNFRRL